MRNIGAVIDSIMLFVPEEETALFHDLNSIMSSVRYSPPELMYLHWRRLAEALQDAIGDIPEVDWHYEVLSLFSTVPVSQIKADVLEHNAACS